MLPLWRLLSAAHETVAWVAAPVALALLARMYVRGRRGNVPLGECVALLAWTLAAVLTVNVGPIEYGEQAGPGQSHAGTAVVPLHPLAGLVPLGIVATVTLALIAVRWLDREPATDDGATDDGATAWALAPRVDGEATATASAMSLARR